MFSDGGLTIRAVEQGDLEPIRQLRNDPSTWIHLTTPGFIESDGQERWHAAVRESSDRKYYVVCDSTRPFIGLVRTDEIDRVNRSMRVGADIVPELRGQGLGSQLYGLLKRFCFDQLNMHRIWLAVLESNEHALRLYEKQGFRHEGRYREAVFRDGRFIDYLVMSILEDEYRTQSQRTVTGGPK